MIISLGEFETEARWIKGKRLEILVYNICNQSEAFTFVVQRNNNPPHTFPTSWRDPGSNVSTNKLRLMQV